MKSNISKGSMLLATTMLVSPAVFAQDEDADTPVAVNIPSITDEIIVRGTNIPEPQRATSQVASFLAKADLDRTGDANAALALTRLSGLSVVGGRFAYVRGLGDRYSAARLNGSPLPSPEPLRRTVPLDLFPSNVLEGAAVQKTYSVDYPAEFGGGIIDLQTLRSPAESFLNVKLGVGLNTVTTGSDGIFVNGGDLDFLGYDDGTRSVPDALATFIDSRTALPLNSSDPATLEVIGESLVNSPLSVIQNGTLGPNYEATIDAGKTFDIGSDVTLGLVAVAGYDQSWTTEESIRQVAVNDVIGLDFNTTETSLDVTVNALGSATAEWDNHTLQGTLLYIHSTTKQSQIDEGADFNAPLSGVVFDESSSFLERQLGMGQLVGEHSLSDQFEVNWRTAFARSTRDSPYEQDLRRIVDTTTGTPLYAQANNRNIVFSELKDDNFSAGVDFTWFAPVGDFREADVTVGFEFSETDRTYDFLALRFAGGNSLPADVQAARPDFLFSPDNIDASRFFLIETSTNTDSYDGELITRAAYAQLDAELIPTVRTTVGVRYEHANQSVITFDRLQTSFGPGSQLSNDYVLPSATLTWNFADDMQFRLGYSHTVGRPQFRELAPALFFDPATDRSYRGNRHLIDSEFRNYDARFEYYLGSNQFFTLAGFYKTIENPIEEIVFETSTFVFDTTFINSPKAELFGGEFEYRTRFLIDWNDWFDRRDWIFSVNYTYTNSEIKVETGDTVADPFSVALTQLDATAFGLDGAPLQGTPEHIVNAQFGWEDEDDQFTILLGWVDERILQRGTSTVVSGGLPDIIEQPGIQLDVNFRHDIELFNTPFTIGLSARNLLGERHEEFQRSPTLGRTEFNTYERGRTLSASLTARF